MRRVTWANSVNFSQWPVHGLEWPTDGFHLLVMLDVPLALGTDATGSSVPIQTWTHHTGTKFPAIRKLQYGLGLPWKVLDSSNLKAFHSRLIFPILEQNWALPDRLDDPLKFLRTYYECIVTSGLKNVAEFSVVRISETNPKPITPSEDTHCP